MNDYRTNLKIRIQSPEKNYQIIGCEGDLDKAGLDENRQKIEELVNNFTLPYMIFDLSKLGYINSESIGFIMMIHSHLAKLGKTLIVVDAKTNVKDVFQVIGLFNVVQYFDTLASAMSKINA